MRRKFRPDFGPLLLLPPPGQRLPALRSAFREVAPASNKSKIANQNSKISSPHSIAPLRFSRRRFLQSSSASLALFNIVSLSRAAERLTPNEKLNIAGIGIGSRGGADLEDIAKLGHNIVALCDVD